MIFYCVHQEIIMIDYEKIVKKLNRRLMRNGFKERFKIEVKSFDGEEYTFCVIKNEVDERLNIELFYDGGEWILYFLGTHEHLRNNGDTLENVFIYINLVLNDKIACVPYFYEGELGMMSYFVLPDEIPFTFTEEEKPKDGECRIYRWSGEVLDDTVRCFVTSERRDVEELKWNLLSPLPE